LNQPGPSDRASHPSFGEAVRYWHRLGWTSFGGPVAQIAMMHEDIVVRKKWVDEGRFQHAMNFCMLLPGPEAQQLATYLGWLMHGVRGGLAAGLLFILPSIFILLAFATAYVHLNQIPAVAGFFAGLKPAVFALILVALIRIGRKNLRHDAHVWTACAAFVLSLAHVPFVLILGAAAAAGWRWHDYYVGPAAPEGSLHVPHFDRLSPGAWRLAAIGIGLWLLPLLLAYGLTGRGDWFRQLGIFYTGTALFSFGGAYTVLPYVWQGAVHDHGWITTTQMMNALALGETTPGPLIMIVAFVGHVSSWNHLHLMDWTRDLYAVLSGLTAVWYTFLPSFLSILLGAPHVEKLRHLPRFSGPLVAISAAVAGLIALLAVQALGHVIGGASLVINGVMAAEAGAAFYLLYARPRIPTWAVVLGAGVVGAVLKLS
jgi:chromate transporter